jgi:hypothetical protein
MDPFPLREWEEVDWEDWPDLDMAQGTGMADELKGVESILSVLNTLDIVGILGHLQGRWPKIGQANLLPLSTHGPQIL